MSGSNDDLKAWVSSRLSMLLGFESGEVADYLLSMPVGNKRSEDEVRTYLKEFLGDTREVGKLADEFIAKRKQPPGSRSAGGSGSKGPMGGAKGGGKPPSQPQATAASASKGGDDFWGGGSAAAPSRQPRSQSSSPAPQAKAPSPLPPPPAPVKAPSPPPPPAPVKAPSPPPPQQASVGAASDFWGDAKVPARKEAGQAAAATGKATGPAKGGGGQGAGGKKGGAKKGEPPSQQLDATPATAVKKGGGGGGAAGGGTGGGANPASRAPPPGFAAVTDTSKPAEKPKATCRCMGTSHKPLGNCLQCGKIACQLEGWTSCTFCGVDLKRHGHLSQQGAGARQQQRKPGEQPAVAPVTSYGQTLEDAVALKEKLLMFDRTLAERSRVFDDQADYYSNTDWLSEEEKAAIAAKEEARREAMDTRSRSVTIGIDLAGRRIVHYDDDNPMPKLDDGPRGSGDHVGAEVAAILEEMGARPNDRAYENEGLTGRAREVYESLGKHFDDMRSKKKAARAGSPAAAASRTSDFLSSGRVQYDADGDGGVEESKGSR